MDYTARLRQDVNRIRIKVRKGLLQRKHSNRALSKVTGRYVLAQADHYHREKDLGKTPPIPFRDGEILHVGANIVMNGFLTWSHADKMSLVEFPIMSDSQQRLRQRREMSLSDVYTGKDDVTIGKTLDHSGVKRRIYDYMTPERDVALVPAEYLDLYDALDNAELTDRQRQAVDLVYFGGMTQDVAADVMNVGQDVVSRHISLAIRKLREYMTKY